MRLFIAKLFTLCLLVAASPVQAADGGDIQRFHPSTTPWGGAGTASGETLSKGKWVTGLTLNYANSPLVQWGRNERLASTIEHNLTVHANGAYGIFDWLTLEAEVPFVAYQAGDEDGYVLAGQAVGDLRFAPRFRILNQEDHGVALSLAATVTVPLGGAEALAGDPSVGVIPEAAISYRGTGVTVAGQLAVRVRKDLMILEGTEMGTEATLRFAAALEFTPTVEGLLEFNGGLAFATLADGLVGNPLEVLAGARFRPSADLAVTVGAGTALLSAPGTPDVRLVASVAFGSGASTGTSTSEK